MQTEDQWDNKGWLQPLLQSSYVLDLLDLSSLPVRIPTQDSSSCGFVGLFPFRAIAA